MTRILILMLGAMLTLAGCGGGDGLEYGTPQVTVKNLEGTVTVSVGGDSQDFDSNKNKTHHTFEKIQNNKKYNVIISGNDSCGFEPPHHSPETHDEPNQHTSSKNASERFVVNCKFDASSDDGEPNAPHVSLRLIGNVGKADNPIANGKNAQVEVRLTENNSPIPSALLQARVSPSDVARLSSETIATNEDGIATISLSNGSQRGAAELVVTYVKRGEELAERSIVISSEGGNNVEVVAEGQIEIGDIKYAEGKEQIEDGYEAIVEVTVTDSEGKPAEKASILFELNRNNGDIGRLGVETAQTDEHGKASVKIFAGAKPGVGVIKASVFHADKDTNLIGLSKSKAFKTKGDEKLDDDGEINYIHKIEFVDGGPIDIAQRGKKEVEVKVTSIEGNKGVEGALVRFEIEDSGVGRLDAEAAVTNEEGIAKITLFAGSVRGASNLIAKVEGAKNAEKAFSTKGGEPADEENSADVKLDIVIAPDKIEVGSEATVEVTVTPNDADDGYELEGHVIRFVTENSLGELEGNGLAITNDEGVAKIQLGSGTMNGRDVLVATFEDINTGKTKTAKKSFTVGEQPLLTLLLVEAGTENPIKKLSSNNQTEVLIKFEPNNEKLKLDEQMIRFTSVIGAVLDKETVMLDENGEARVSIVPTDLEGAGTLVAVLEGNSSVTATRHFATKGDGSSDGTKPYPVTIYLWIDQGNEQDVDKVDNARPATVQIKLKGDGEDIKNRLVVVASTVGSVAPTTVLTDEEGKASVALNTKNIWGAGVITATLQSNEGKTLAAKSKSFGIKGEMPGEVSIAIELTDNNGDPIGTPQHPITQDTPANIKVTVKQGTDEIAGELVRVSSDLGELSPASGTTITNDDGEATSLILRAGNEAGAGTLTASIMIDGMEYDESVYFLTWGANNYDPNEPLVLELDLKGKETGDYPNSENPITDSNPATVTATLTRGGIEIPDALIRFETDLGVIDPSTGTALTDADGMAEVTLQIADESGAGTITATYDKGDGLVVEKHFEMTQTKDGLQLSELELLDSNDNSGNGLIGKELSATNMAIARVRLVTDSGMPIENEIIYFHVENTHPVDGDNGDLIGIVNPRSALTDSNGYATVELTAGAAGAARLIATYNWKGTELRRSTPFMSLGDEQSPQEPDHIPELGYVADATDPENTFEKGGLELIGFGANDNIPAGSTISIGVNLVDAQNNNAPWPGIVRVQFNSLCADREDGSASIDSEVALINGRGIATYVAKDPSCEADVIYAEVNVDGKQLEAVSRQFSIDHSEASYIEFVSATPEQIGLKGSGDAGVPETATLTFQVKNADGFTVPAGTKVNFEAVNPLGGFKVDTPSAVTNNNGRVEVKVVSGHMPYSASVKATLDADDTVFGYGSIKVSTGVVTQDRFRLSLSEFNVAAWNHTEVTVDVTVSAADRMGNHSDGTDVYFTTEVGRIDDFCTIENGSCTVKWHSQGAAVDRFDAGRQARKCLANTVEAIKRGVVKPFDCWNAIDADGMGEVAWRDRFGRNTITAYAAGEESFRDVNGNNIFDEAEYDLTATADEAAWRAENRYFPLASPFRDDNETALYEEGIDEFHDFSDVGITPDYGSMTLDSRRFRGVGCSQEARDYGHCAGLTHVRDSVSMVLGTDVVVMTVIKKSDLFALTDLDIEHGEVSGEDQPETARFKLINGPNVGQYVGELNTSTLDAAGETVYVFVHDLNGNGLANGSKIEAEGGGALTNVSNGCANIANNSTEPEICSITFSPGNPADSIPTIKLVGPNGVTLERTFTIQ